jgi:HPt (histidine-containing phosphotransfer) domain-containing protein
MTDEVPVLDPAVLDELRESVGNDDEFIAELVATYVNEGGEHLDAMEHAAQMGDAGAIVRPAHTLKSSSAALGALRLAQIAREIEMAGRNDDATGLVQRVAEARATWDETLRAMAAAGLTK